MAGSSKYTDEQYAQVDELLEAGASVTEASNSTGVPRGSIYQRVRRKVDPKPGGSNKRGGKSVREPASDDALIHTFERFATFPAIPAKLILHCDYCSNHFTTSAPQAATELVELSKDYPALRDILETVHSGWTKAAWAGILISFLGVPVAHHTLSPELFSWFAVIVSAQQVGATPRPTHTHTNGGDPLAGYDPTHTPYEEQPGPTPFTGLDIDSLMGMAAAMGVQIPDPGMLAQMMGQSPPAATDDVIEGQVITDSDATEGPTTESEPAEQTAESLSDDALAEAVAAVTTDPDSGE
jgi:hypothetical protein